ncbi:hypothetical protein KZI27_00865 (plasmid) [Curtobacterium sp. TC1]|uniref:hypothetical protein n=1 Tax=Curtobacterium sp. TC1 TaxID=2862880 RepID=UPI001C9B193A|nr:hypothetical protein [Curtobacterium sp. TC1]QZQ53775.1 hypothetical protein KZI27_00865 [Curtobacterium sp. TC1]
MTKTPEHSAISRIIGAVFGVIGLAIWWTLVMSLVDSLSGSQLATLGGNKAFLILGAAAGIGFVFTFGFAAMWAWEFASSRRNPRA